MIRIGKLNIVHLRTCAVVFQFSAIETCQTVIAHKILRSWCEKFNESENSVLKNMLVKLNDKLQPIIFSAQTILVRNKTENVSWQAFVHFIYLLGAENVMVTNRFFFTALQK